MKCLQYIYTSWKNGDSLEKGYMVYSKSNGITDEESNAIKDIMRYTPPKGLPINPTNEEIEDEFPYCFAYFKLPSQRVCIAHTKYLGKDYSGRFGNYIVYALVIKYDDLEIMPTQLFGERYIKTYMTESELNAKSPIQALPMLEINNYGNVINNEVITEFASDNQQDSEIFISVILEGLVSNKPVFINDTREKLVLWMALIETILPNKLSKQFYFSTYVADHDTVRSETGFKLNCIGIRPDSNYFDYSREKNSSRQIVVDFINNIITENIKVKRYARDMINSLVNSTEILNDFKEFISNTNYGELNNDIINAYNYFKLLNLDIKKYEQDEIVKIIQFGREYCTQSNNINVATKILEVLKERLFIINYKNLKIILEYLFEFASHKLLSIYELLYDSIFEFVNEVSFEKAIEFNVFIKSMKIDMSLFINGYLDYFRSQDTINTSYVYLGNHGNSIVIKYYLVFIGEFFDLNLEDGRNRLVNKLFYSLLNDLSNLDCATNNILEVMRYINNNPKTYVDILVSYRNKLKSKNDINSFYQGILKQIDDLEDLNRDKLEKIITKHTNILIEFFVIKLENSKNPKDDFEKIISRIFFEFNDNEIKLDSLIDAYLIALNKDDKFEEVISIFSKQKQYKLSSRYTIINMVSIIEDGGIKKISKIEDKLLKDIDILCKQNNIINNSIYAVKYGKYISNLINRKVDKSYILDKVKDSKLNLNNLDKRDYEMYLEKYFEPLIKDTSDICILDIGLNKFCNNNNNKILFDLYINNIKRLQKRKDKNNKWEDVIVTICRYTIKNINNPVVALFEDELMSYFNKIKSEDLLNIQFRIDNEIDEQYKDSFLAKIKDREIKKNIFSKLFRKG